MTTNEPFCTKCDAPEVNPNTNLLLVRGYKVADSKGYWWSQCLVCSGFYDKSWNETPENHNSKKGWF